MYIGICVYVYMCIYIYTHVNIYIALVSDPKTNVSGFFSFCPQNKRFRKTLVSAQETNVLGKR